MAIALAVIYVLVGLVWVMNDVSQPVGIRPLYVQSLPSTIGWVFLWPVRAIATLSIHLHLRQRRRFHQAQIVESSKQQPSRRSPPYADSRVKAHSTSVRPPPLDLPLMEVFPIIMSEMSASLQESHFPAVAKVLPFLIPTSWEEDASEFTINVRYRWTTDRDEREKQSIGYYMMMELKATDPQLFSDPDLLSSFKEILPRTTPPDRIDLDLSHGCIRLTIRGDRIESITFQRDARSSGLVAKAKAVLPEYSETTIIN